ncbi:hypothetical protein GCK72_003056 [Caenorhabditis remanei]|uniref:PAZ domain-containing protein n=1 Tax=Caenorhabditis remanei TaxID=31234 RepID=A0A6A5HSR8_CAERE|nr:hypothetical protein GCK72_003056 [Caenorhabditis remanei]KAF1771230.1 hypothetical protein GCK72_003056 [Caenorhabditis remanei]
MLKTPTMITAWNVASEEKILNPIVVLGEKIGFTRTPNSSETMIVYYNKYFGIDLRHASSPVVRGMDEDDEDQDSQEEEEELDLDFA